MLDVMRRYVYGFVNSHDPAVAREVMVDDYRLNMGSESLVGRDDQYIPAVLHQIAQFPELTFSIHELVTDGIMTALMFSEHGRSGKQPDAGAAWRGVSIYRAEHGSLAECWVEQDHYGRRHQLATGQEEPVRPVALDPWSGHQKVTDADRDAARSAVGSWAADLVTWPPRGTAVDAGISGTTQPRVEVTATRVNALVAEGGRVAFNATIEGRYGGGLPGLNVTGAPVVTYIGAFATLQDGELVDVDAISNRVAVQRQLRAARDQSVGSTA